MPIASNRLDRSRPLMIPFYPTAPMNAPKASANDLPTKLAPARLAKSDLNFSRSSIQLHHVLYYVNAFACGSLCPRDTGKKGSSCLAISFGRCWQARSCSLHEEGAQDPHSIHRLSLSVVLWTGQLDRRWPAGSWTRRKARPALRVGRSCESEERNPEMTGCFRELATCTTY